MTFKRRLNWNTRHHFSTFFFDIYSSFFHILCSIFVKVIYLFWFFSLWARHFCYCIHWKKNFFLFYRQSPRLLAPLWCIIGTHHTFPPRLSLAEQLSVRMTKHFFPVYFWAALPRPISHCFILNFGGTIIYCILMAKFV